MDEEKKKKFALFTDAEWIENLIKTPADEDVHEYFFKIKCKGLLKFVSISIFNSEDFEELIGEFYVLLSSNNWHILRQFKSKNSAKLNSFLSRCVTNHFITKRNKEKRISIIHTDDDNTLYDKLINTADECEKNIDTTDVMMAYERLGSRDKDVLRLLVLDGKSSMEAAEELWPIVNSNKDWRDLPIKRVQDTIAMIKHRAILRLTTEVNRLT